MKLLSDLTKKDLFGKICLLRVDLNISNAELRRTNTELRKKNFHINPRFLGILPTIEFLVKNGAKVVLLSHRGRPNKDSRFKIQDSRLSLKPFASILSRLLNKPVQFIDFNLLTSDVINIRKYQKGSIFLLENLRFLTGEEKNDEKLAKQLSSLGNFYVNDAFAVSHRNAASVVAITKFLPSYVGLLLEKEINSLCLVMENPKKPLVVILGGAKISDKIGLIENFLQKTDYFLIGGGMAHNFLLAQGLPIGDSIYEKSKIDFVKKIMKNKNIILPVDYVIDKNKILDIGSKTIKMYVNIIKKAKTIIWNGPMGYFEDKRFAKGSEAIAKAIVNNKKAFSVIGGGETSAVFQMIKIKNQAQLTTGRAKLLKLNTACSCGSGALKVKNNVFVSTGGGAMLEFLAGKDLPGIKALKKL